MITNKNLYHIKSKYIANALAVLGFKYYVFDNELSTKVKSYAFIDTELFRSAYADFMSLKSKYNNQ